MLRLAGPIHLASPDATDDLGARFAPVLGPGDVLLLSGAIGAGKTAFARALIQARLGRPEDVPSPTFTLVQTYDAPAKPRAPACEIWHADLYRLTGPGEAVELGLEEAFTDAICLVEWPDRLGDLTPPEALRLDFAALDRGHEVTFHGPPGWRPRLERILA
ncbi:tRNA (adenosine(37)-N6)-threonylcarbamoyltransferase complex ATPase subunit type 1 TsaE [Roseisalinus antarcticus]|uniref:tRNA threonylcarbamoyladenosine biosynthesis protein TsaE n=1 Tax=Roseisalinus antarcticus TaxID=254357 RepID=A0A1Y5S1N8_9RHOB|nr:tRNA (adenosine(37)-N6)-threonylcarbamoyltransferase complex ATPase subunit type 1 TsaE [Roseisalinus antarcticus]SLN30572.1 tRNA threonylcarbamoyladenosine biosynthesis protein TsaE [Roseisalinus antarcticus]